MNGNMEVNKLMILHLIYSKLQRKALKERQKVIKMRWNKEKLEKALNDAKVNLNRE